MEKERKEDEEEGKKEGNEEKQYKKGAWLIEKMVNILMERREKKRRECECESGEKRI